ncbi:MAG: ABC transporter permease [Lachnospiraceae bacterium]|nr:ABC transporter permease [Lachnospiraceae bacterium]
MQRVLRKRVFRNLRKHFVRYFMLGIMIAMSIFLVVTIVGSGETLSRGTVDLAEKTNLEDGEFKVFSPLNDSEVKQIGDMGIELEEQFYFDYQMEDEDEGTVRIFKIRDRINRIHYISGKEPEDKTGLVMEKRYAEEHDLKVGDSFEIAGKSFCISGIGVVSDYDGPFKEISDTSCNSKAFGLVFLTEEAYEEFKTSGKAQRSEDYSYSYKLGGGKEDGDLKDYLKELKADLPGAYDGMPKLTSFLKQSDNPRIFATKNDKIVDIEVGMIAGVIIFILLAYVISVFVVHSIERESSIIGTLYSMGVTRNDLLLHYVTLPVVVSFIAGLVGLMAASTGILAPMIAESSYMYFSIPVFSFRVPKYLWIYSLVCPPLMAVAVNVIVIRSKLSRTALSLIRNEVKQGKNKKIRLGRMDFVRAFRIRQMLRELRSTFAVVLGMFLSLLVFMIAVDCYTLCTNIAKDYKADTKYEYMYMLKYSEMDIPKDAEAAYAYTCRKKTMGLNFDVTILGIDEDNRFFDVDPGKSRMDVVVSNAFAEKFGLKKGEEFVVTDDEKEMKYAFTVKAITQYSAGFYIFMDIDEMRGMMGVSDDYYNVLFSDRKLDIDPDSLYSETTREDVVKGTTVFTDLMMPMICVVSAASVIIFCVVLYLMMKVMIDRSAQNISLIKVFGYRRNEIRKLYLDGNFYVIAIGALIVIPLSKVIMNSLFPFMISNVSCGLNLNTPKLFYIITYAVIIVLYLVINKLLVKRLDKYTPAEILKNRE